MYFCLYVFIACIFRWILRTSAFLPVIPATAINSAPAVPPAVGNSGSAPARESRNTYQKAANQRTLPFTVACQSNSPKRQNINSYDATTRVENQLNYENRRSGRYENDDDYMSYVSTDYAASRHVSDRRSGNPQSDHTYQSVISRDDAAGDVSGDSIEITYNPAFSPIYEDIPSLPQKSKPRAWADSDVTKTYDACMVEPQECDLMGRLSPDF